MKGQINPIPAKPSTAQITTQLNRTVMKKSFKAITSELRSFIVSNFELTSSHKGQDEVEIDISTKQGDFSMYIENDNGQIMVETIIMCCDTEESLREQIIKTHRKLKELCNGSFFRFEFDII